MEIMGNYAYIADNEAGLRIIDISNPASPQEVGFVIRLVLPGEYP